MFDNVGIGEILIILLVVLILFGSKKLPDLAQGLGKGIREFKKAIKDVENDINIPDEDKKVHVPDEDKKVHVPDEDKKVHVGK